MPENKTPTRWFAPLLTPAGLASIAALLSAAAGAATNVAGLWQWPFVTVDQLDERVQIIVAAVVDARFERAERLANLRFQIEVTEKRIEALAPGDPDRTDNERALAMLIAERDAIERADHAVDN